MTVADLVQRFEISPATARRDATLLAEAGKAARSHGGLLPARFYQNEPHFKAKSLRRIGIKNRLARKAAELLPHEGNLFVDAGTTCFEVGRILIERPDLRIFTNSIPLLGLAGDACASLTGIGGEARKVSLALTGALAQSWLGHLRFDCAVVGASGFDADAGAYTTEIHEAAIKAEVLKRSTHRVLVAEAEKLGQPTAVHFAPWQSFTHLVTGTALPRDVRRSIAAAGVHLNLV